MADIPDFTPLPGASQAPEDVPDFTSLPGKAAPPKYGGKLLDNASADDPGGFAKNTGTGLAKMAMHVPGFVGDARELGEFLGSNLLSLAPGEKRSARDIREDFTRNRALNADIMASTHGPTSLPRRIAGRAQQAFAGAPTGADIYAGRVAPVVGEYKPVTMPGRMYQAGLESALPMPGGKAALITKAAEEVPRLLPRIAGTAGKMATSSPVVGGAMGATAEGIGEATDSAGAGIGAAMIIPSILRHAVPRASTYDTAADKLYGSLHRPDEALDQLRAIGKKGYKGAAESPLDLPEAAGDQNLAHVSKQHGVADTEFGSRVNDLRGAQAANREGALGGLSTGDSSSVSATARQMRDDIHAKADTDTQLQQKIVDTLHPPEGADKAASGKKAFDIAEANNERARAAVTKLYKGIDPDNKIHVDLAPMNLKASQILIEGTNPQKFLPSPEAEKVLAMARDMPPSMTFNDLVDFDKTVGQARWRATRADDPHGAGMLRQLQDHIDTIRDGSLDRRAAWEKGAVERGELKPDQTVAANLERQRADAAAGRRDATASAVEGQPGAAGRASPAVGTVAEPAPAHPAGDQNVPGNTLDPDELADASARQDLAKQGHGDRKTMFEEGPVGGFLNADKPLMGNVPGSAFAAGPAGGEKARAWLNAGVDNPGMLDAVKEMAITELHGLSSDGVVTPQALAKWKNRYGSALSEIDQRDPGFSRRFDAHAGEQQKLLDTAAQSDAAKKTFGKTEAAKLLGMEHPQEVDAHVAGLMGSKVGPQRLRELMTQFEDHPEAQEGVRNAAAQWLVDKAQSRELLRGPDGSPVHASAPGNYLAALVNAQPHMEAVFGVDGYKAAQQVAEEMARTKQMIDARITRGGSDSVKNLVQYLNDASSSGHALSTAEGFATWETLREAMTGIMHADPSALARAGGMFATRVGLHKWSEMLARKRGHGIQESGDLIREALLDPAYGHEMLEHGARRAQARAPRDLLERLAGPNTLQRGNVAASEVERQGHAAGGAVKLDHAAHAARLVRDVPRVRRDISAGTEPMLKLPDNVVTKALAIANQGLG